MLLYTYDYYYNLLLLIFSISYLVKCNESKDCIIASDGKSITSNCNTFTIETLDNVQTIICLSNNFQNIIDEIRLKKDQFNTELVKLKIISCPMSYENQSFMNVIKELKLNTIESLTLKYTQIKNFTLSYDFFNNFHKIHELFLSTNRLENVHETIFDSVNELQILDLSYNHLRNNLTKWHFKHLKILEKLFLNSNFITYLDSDIFSFLINLKYLDLTDNILTKLPHNLFQTNFKLEVLKFTSNKIYNISDAIFTNLANLQSLYFDNNHLTILSRIFSSNISFTSFNKLVLKNNVDLNKIEGDLFQSISNIQELILTKCSFRNFSKNLFRNLNELRNLQIGYNRLNILDPDLFTGLKKLLKLSLENNELSQIKSEHQFDDLVNLEELYLNNNNLIILPNNLFSKLYNLKYLNIGFNRLETISSSVELLENLEYLDLQQNRIKEYSVLTLNQIQFIDLSYNQIKIVDQNVLINAMHLKYFNLSHNQITYIDEENLQISSRENLFINLTSNRISQLRFSKNIANNFQQVNNRFTFVYLQNNMLTCDCSLYDLINYFEYGKSFSLKIVQKDLTCFDNHSNQTKLIEFVQKNQLFCHVFNEYNSICNSTCICIYVPFEQQITIDCSNRQLSNWPNDLDKFLNELHTNQTIAKIRLNFENNHLTNFKINYDKVVFVNLSYNLLNDINQIPHKLQTIDLRHNNLSHFNNKYFLNAHYLQSVYLDDNPWICDCNNLKLSKYTNLNELKINCDFMLQMDHNYCKFRPYFIYMVIVIFASIFLSLANLMYWYRKEIRIWLYVHNLLFCFDYYEIDDDKKYDAFCSYSHEDDNFVSEYLKPFLEDKNGYKICFYGRDWLPGFTIPDLILNSVENSRRTIIVLSKSFLNSTWANEEFHVAYNYSKKGAIPKLIVLVLDNINIDKDIEDEVIKKYLRHNIYLKWDDPWFWHKLQFAMPHFQQKKISL